MNRNTRVAGLTVVELLIAGFILVVVIGAAAIFFGQQATLQRNVQARNELQDRVRTAMQLVSQDLSLAGNSVVLTSTGSKDESVSWPYCFDGGKGCLQLVEEASNSSNLSVRYLSSQFSTGDACRDVTYRLTDGLLERSDVPCEEEPEFFALADNVLTFKTTIICSDGTPFNDFPHTNCGGGKAYGRSAEIEIEAQSAANVGSGTSGDCPAGKVCFSLTQEVLIPNMKDG